MTATIDIGTLIESTPVICGDRPRITATRIPVYSIVMDYKAGMSVEEIAQELPHLNLAQIYSALAYYYANQQQIEADILTYQKECEFWENEYKAGRL